MRRKGTINKNWKVILGTYMIIMYSICITICTALMIMHFFGLAHDNEWLSFWGSIIGGLFTLVGVWWTIKKQETQRREDLAIEYMPLIHCKVLNTHFDGHHCQLDLLIKNIGRGEAKQFHTHIFDPINNYTILKKDLDYIAMANSLDSTIELTIEIDFPMVNENTNNIIIAKFNYTDLIYLKKYNYDLIIDIIYNSNGYFECHTNGSYMYNGIL